MTKTETAIAAAVEPLRARAVDRAIKHAEKVLTAVYGELEAAGWNIQAVAPYPKGSCWAAGYREAVEKYKFFSSLVTHKHGTPIVAKNEAAAERFVKEAGEQASSAYDAFIGKLNAKVGEHKAATLNGCHVWGYSILTVEKADGTSERWKTQTIINVSKLGKVFNQYPTRKVK